MPLLTATTMPIAPASLSERCGGGVSGGGGSEGGGESGFGGDGEGAMQANASGRMKTGMAN